MTVINIEITYGDIMILSKLFHLDEMALLKTSIIGDTDSEDEYAFDKNDKKMLSTKNIERTKTMFRNSKYDFSFYYIPNSGIYEGDTQYGQCTYTNLIELVPNISEDDAKSVFIDNTNAITLVFTGNHAMESDRIPLTGWIQAHRAIHALAFPQKNMPKKLDLWERVMKPDILSLLQCYDITDSDGGQSYHFDKYGGIVGENGYYDENQFPDEFIESIVATIGTMLSSKKNKISRNAEFFMECGAQQILRNHISLENRLHSELSIWGHSDNYLLKLKSEDIVDNALRRLEKRWDKMFDTILKHSVGKVFLM
jgi:hypothetical protein